MNRKSGKLLPTSTYALLILLFSGTSYAESRVYRTYIKVDSERTAGNENCLVRGARDLIFNGNSFSMVVRPDQGSSLTGTIDSAGLVKGSGVHGRARYFLEGKIVDERFFLGRLTAASANGACEYIASVAP